MKTIAIPILFGLMATCGHRNTPANSPETDNFKPETDNFGFETDSFVTPDGKTVKIHALTHASIRIEYDGKEIEIDPVCNAGSRTIDYTKFPKADVILVTHEHFDHLDPAAIATLTKNGTQLFINRNGAAKLGHGTVMANGGRTEVGGWLTVEAVPAYNTTEGHLQFHPKGRDNGYVLTIGGLRIYIAGDTEDIPEMDSVKNIDVAFLPCNQPYTMTPEQIIRAARRIRPKVLFPYHYSQTDLSRLADGLKGDGIDVRIRNYQ